MARMRGHPGAARMAKLLARPTSLAALGGLLLALGILVYLADRQPGHALLLPAWPRLADGAWFGSAGAWLPSFVHPLAFSLLTVAALGPSRRLRLGACALASAPPGAPSMRLSSSASCRKSRPGSTKR